MIHDQHTADTADTDAPPVLLPTDRPRRPGAPPRCSAVERAELEVRPTNVLNGPNELLLAGFAALLYRYTGQERIVVDRADATGRTGRVHLLVTGDSTLRELAGSGDTTGAAAPGSVGVRFAPPGEPVDGELPHELHLVVRTGTPRRTALELHYDTDLFDRSTAVRLLTHYRTLVEDGARFPDLPVARLRLLSDAERWRMLVAWNKTETDLPHDRCLHQAFEAGAERSPDAVAVVDGERTWTYRQVNVAANRLAHHLRTIGVGPDVRVGLCLDRSAGLLTSILGILKAGGAYVPIDPDYPAQRIATMVDATSCAVMISREDLAANLPVARTGGHLLLLDRDADVLSSGPEHDLGLTAGPDDLCYIIHTSGSTGAPKPIALRHRGVMNNLADLNGRFQVGAGDSVLALSSPSFDMSVYEFLGMTIAGGTVVIPDPGRGKDPAHWAELLTTHDVTVWNSAPALLGLLVDHLEQTGTRHLPRLRLALLGGDWVPVPLPDRVRRLAPRLRFIVMGGATESSIHSTIYEVESTDPNWTSIPYGSPMANQRTYILDEARQPVPPGVPGELYLAGVGLARGYLDQPEQTAERFITWSHGQVTDERLYRTGDLARFRRDGLIELLGRIDFQVKINGMRVELPEIEAVLRAHPGVGQVAVIAREGRLVAYVVPAETPAETQPAGHDELRALAADSLPEFMVPRAFVTLDELPLTPNGKLDRRNLPEPQRAATEYRAPRSATERTLAEVFADVLGVARVGIDDDFLVAGGDSVRSIQAVTRARARGLEITTRQVLEHRTVAALATIATGTSAAPDEDTAVPLATASQHDLAAWTRRYPRLADVWPLTAMQSGMLFESMLNDTGEDPYHLQTIYHLSGRVDAARMRAAGQALLDRHANLRVAFVSDAADNLVQLVVDGVELPWHEIDLGTLEAGERAVAFQRFLTDDRSARMDLTAPPLLRMTLVRFGPERAELVLTVHHALIDGWSEQVLARELRRLYAAAGDTSALEPVRGFRDFLAWLSQVDREASARAWADELADLDGPTLLTPHGAPSASATRLGEVVVTLTPGEVERLARCCAELGVTMSSLVQGAWAVLLSVLTGRADVVFGATVSGRPDSLSDVESMVGLFINTVPVRVRCAPGETAAELLTELRHRQTALVGHHHHGLTDIHRAAGLDALFDTLVVFQSFPDGLAGVEATDVEITGVDSVGGVNYPLALFVEPGRLVLQYHRDRYDEDAAEHVLARFRSIMHQLATEPARPVGAVDVLLATERDRILGRGDAASGLRTHDMLPTLVERHAAATPDVVAVVSEGTCLSYGELNARANRLARTLIRRGAGPESVVAIAPRHPTQLAVALLGTLKSGAAYVVVDPDGAQRAAVPGAMTTLTAEYVDDPAATDETDPTDRDRGAPLLPRHLACVRSGAEISHRALADGLLGFAAGAGLARGRRMLVASPHLDAVAFEILAALCAGAGVEVVEDVRTLGRQRGWTGDVVSTVAPLFAGMLNRSPGAVEADTVVFTGDGLTGSFVRRVGEAMPGVRVVTTYGRVETVRSTVDNGAGERALGAPLDGVRAYVLSPALRLLPEGVTGELYVAGSVARGYHGRPGPTAERFVADPYGPPGSRMYRTGDLARWNGDGRLEYAGRADARARVRAQWVRTHDVEAVLAEHPAVALAAVVAGKGAAPGGDDRLVGYVVPAGEVQAEDLREFVARRLPDHMVPTTVVLLEELPSTVDGSVDREALPAPDTDEPAAGHRAGRTPREEALCEIFAEILGVDRIGIDDNFLSLGVNSLMAGRLVSRMHRNLGIKLSIRAIFQNPTIAKLSGQVQATTTKSRPRLRKMTST